MRREICGKCVSVINDDGACDCKKRRETMKHTNAQIAANIHLWNEYFNTSALMTDKEFYEMTYNQRVQMLVDAFGPDEEYEDEYEDEYEEEEDTMSGAKATTERGAKSEAWKR